MLAALFRRLNRSAVITPRAGFLMRLARDRRGNTLAIMAAALVPMIGMAGSAVDMARLYVVKVRLQQACDAGALAGRRAMTDTTMSTPMESAASDQASSFFRNNFPAGWYRTANVRFTPVKASVNTDPNVANGVNATASADVPMAVMSFFRVGTQTVSVTCQAVYDVPDADVMFVLDTTGSMTCYPQDSPNCNNGSEKPATTSNGTTTYSKMESLRQSVMLFDSTVRGSTDPNTHIRYGFVTYASSVNVGRLIPSQYLQNSWTYQSRHLSPATGSGGVLPGDYAWGDPSDVRLYNVPRSYCFDQRSPASGFATSGPTWSNDRPQARRYYNTSWTSGNGGTCSGRQQPLLPYWRYEAVTWDTSAFLRTANGGNTADPTRFDGTTTSWPGCIEELNTSTASSFDVRNLPDDLNPDIVPSSDSNKWRPAWPDVVYMRDYLGPQDIRDEDTSDYYRSFRPGNYYPNAGYAICGMPARTLDTMSAQDVRNYVYDSRFKASGGTYHDVGMIWGTRMISPNGVFGATTAAWPGRQAPSRSIVFMTDGSMAPNQAIYGQYGIEVFDNRTGGQNDSQQDYDNHTARFRVECDAAKMRGITIYVVALGTDVTPDLQYCASSGQAFQAKSTESLKAAFRTIAQRVAMLRISQ